MPLAISVQELPERPLVLKPQFLEQGDGAGVVSEDGCRDTMQIQLVEGEAQGQPGRLVADPLSPVGTVADGDADPTHAVGPEDAAASRKTTGSASQVYPSLYSRYAMTSWPAVRAPAGMVTLPDVPETYDHAVDPEPG